MPGRQRLDLLGGQVAVGTGESEVEVDRRGHGETRSARSGAGLWRAGERGADDRPPRRIEWLLEGEGLRRRAGAVEQRDARSEEHTSELQSLMHISYAVFCLKKKNNTHNLHTTNNN